VIRDLGDKSTMKMRNSGNVPGARGERTCQEAVDVVDEVGDNHVDNILRKPSGRGRTCGGWWAEIRLRIRREEKESSLDRFGWGGRLWNPARHSQRILFWFWLTSVPNTFSEQSNRYSGKQRDTAVRQGAKLKMVEVPDSEDVRVFAAIVLLQEVEVRRDHRGKSHPHPSADNDDDDIHPCCNRNSMTDNRL
jgi:hypothetical protein